MSTPQPTETPYHFAASTRRAFLLGAASTVALAACGGSDAASQAEAQLPAPSTADPSQPSNDAAGQSGSYTLVQRFPNNVQIPGTIRMPISLSTGTASLITDGPDSLGAQVVDIDGVEVGERITAIKRIVDPAPYYDFRTTIDTPGFYALVVDNGPATGAAFQVSDPQAVTVPSPGDVLAGFDTPTTTDPQGVSTICTRTPGPCGFHEVTLSAALESGRPVGYYVGTPAFCSTGSCGPALEAIIGAQQRFGDAMTFVHAEVFADDAGTVVAPAVTAVNMTYEPAIFLTDAAGVVRERLDAVWDQTELEEAIARVLA